jgi:hypothetical protein
LNQNSECPGLCRRANISSLILYIYNHNPFEVQTSIIKLKRYKSIGSDLILVKLIEAGGEILLSEISKLIKPIWNKEELLNQWKEPIIIPIYNAPDKCYISLM